MWLFLKYFSQVVGGIDGIALPLGHGVLNTNLIMIMGMNIAINMDMNMDSIMVMDMAIYMNTMGIMVTIMSIVIMINILAIMNKLELMDRKVIGVITIMVAW